MELTTGRSFREWLCVLLKTGSEVPVFHPTHKAFRTCKKPFRQIPFLYFSLSALSCNKHAFAVRQNGDNYEAKVTRGGELME